MSRRPLVVWVLLLASVGCQAADSAPPRDGGAGRPGGSSLPGGRVVHVSPSGSDPLADGSKQNPYGSISRAVDELQPGDTCVLAAGVYRETVRPPRSGAAGKPITFVSAGDGPAVISGADSVSGWTRDRESIWKAKLPRRYVSSSNQSLQVFFKGKMMHLARWPDHGSDVDRPQKADVERFISKSRANEWTTGVFEDDDLPDGRADDYVGAGIYLQPDHNAWSWTFSGSIVAREGRRLTLVSRNDSGRTGDPSTYAVGSRYYLFGKRAFLNAPHEWWFDDTSGTLYVVLPAGEIPDDGSIEVKMRDLCFDLDERSHVTLKNLHLFACSVSTDRAAGGDARPYEDDGEPRHPWRGAGSVAPSEGVVLSRVDARYLDHLVDVSGHFYLQWGQGTGIVLSGRNHRIERSRIGPTACNGVTLIGRGHRATNNLIEHANYVSVDCAGITTGGAADSFDHEIDHNTVRHTARSCITLRNLQNSDAQQPRARVHHNDLYGCMKQDWDGGGIYTAVTDLRWTRIDHNWVHDMKGFAVAGIYPDFCKNVVIHHNVVWNVEWGVLSQGQYDDGQSNALCYNNTLSVQNTSGTPYGPFGFAGNRGSNKGSVVRNNIVMLANTAPGYRPISDAWDDADIADNLLSAGSAQDPVFINPAQRDFRLQSGSSARGQGKAIPVYERDGVRVPPFNDETDGAMNLGAYTGDLWQAGCDHLPACKEDLAR